ncbi:hypothetical protein ACP4OV_008924 [Aristida adscensionis]
MAKAVALFFFLGALLLYHLHLGEAGGCSPSDIKVKVVATGRFIGGKPERLVTFQTGCPCHVGDIRVACEGLQRSSVAPDPSKVELLDSADGKVCVLKQWISTAR